MIHILCREGILKLKYVQYVPEKVRYIEQFLNIERRFHTFYQVDKYIIVRNKENSFIESVRYIELLLYIVYFSPSHL